MSDSFYKLGDQSTQLAHMASRRATLFVTLTETAARIYNVREPVIINYDAAYHVYTERMCELVEKVFANPIDILSVWATYAAGMYDILKGEQHIWLWSRGHIEWMPPDEVKELCPVRYADSPQAPPGNKKIGPHWYRDS